MLTIYTTYGNIDHPEDPLRVDRGLIADPKIESCFRNWFSLGKNIHGSGLIGVSVVRGASPAQMETIRSYIAWMRRFYDIRLVQFRIPGGFVEDTAIYTGYELPFDKDMSGPRFFIGLCLGRFLSSDFLELGIPGNITPLNVFEQIFNKRQNPYVGHTPFVNWPQYQPYNCAESVFSFFEHILANDLIDKTPLSLLSRPSSALYYSNYQLFLHKRDNMPPRLVSNASVYLPQIDKGIYHAPNVRERPRDSRGRFIKRETSAVD